MDNSFFYHLFCFTQESYLSKDLGEIYIYGKNCRHMEIRTYVETFRDPVRMIQIFMDFCPIDHNVKICLVMWVII